MLEHTWSSTETTAIIFLAGFAIQQILQIIDPFVIFGIYKFKNHRLTKDLPGGLSDADVKKALMAFLSFFFGAVVISLTNIRLLALLNADLAGVGDFLVSGLVVGTGTEAVNTLLKFLGYVKEAQKPAPAPEISVIPALATVKQSTTFQFTALLSNSSAGVSWQVLHGAGGEVSSTGLYTAPAASGTYQVRVASTADNSKCAIAIVTVVA
ncbi:MAG: hypothetical protein NTW85_09890 [Methylococcales bacterium]|nr:hypothetical protein [Methylococcales bacterium]